MNIKSYAIAKYRGNILSGDVVPISFYSIFSDMIVLFGELTSPERMAVLKPGDTSSAAFSPSTKYSALSTVALPTLNCFAIFSAVRFVFGKSSF